MDDKKHPNQPLSGQEAKEADQNRKSDGSLRADASQKPESGQRVDPSGRTASNASRPANKGTERAKSTGPRRLFSKKWVYPAIYLGAAALIIGLMYVRNQIASTPASSNAIEGTGSNATTTSQSQGPQPVFAWPAAAGTNVQVSLGFFPVKGTQQAQAKALVEYGNAYYPHEGYDLKAQNGHPFEVTASAAGQVTSVVDNKLYGKTVTVTSTDGYAEQYQSLGSVTVSKGDMVRQGQQLGTSGTNLFEKSAGNHLYFEVTKDGQPVDPGALLPQQP